MQRHIDLLVENGDFVIDAAGFAKPIADRQSIGQDIKHRLIESGLLHLLIAHRSPVERDSLINQMTIEVEKDTRLKPGTVQFISTGDDQGELYLTAETLEYGNLKVFL